MKKLLLSTFCLFQGCVTHHLDHAIQSMPGYEFEQIDYARTGNITSTTLNAQGAKIEDNKLIIESVNVVHSNPLFGITASVKGLKRPVSQTSTQANSTTGQ